MEPPPSDSSEGEEGLSFDELEEDEVVGASVPVALASPIVRLAEYHVVRELGMGAQGVVYQAVNEETNEMHAIKEITLPAEGISHQARTEIAIMKRLNHPNVTKFFAAYDSPHCPQTLFLVLEFVEGGSLFSDKEVWAGGAEVLPMERVQDICQQLTRGVSYLHHMGVLHRDIKPSNVLGNRYRGVVKVADFGVSSLTRTQKSARLLGEDDVVLVGTCGTPAFLPPEASGAGVDYYYNARPADVWALGVTFYFFCQGFLPFRGTGRDDTARLICEEPVRFVSKVPSKAKDLILQMLEKNPVKRIGLASVQSHPWIKVESFFDEREPSMLGADIRVSAKEFMNSVSSTRKIVRKRRRSVQLISGMKSALNRVQRSISNNSFKSQPSDSDLAYSTRSFDSERSRSGTLDSMHSSQARGSSLRNTLLNAISLGSRSQSQPPPTEPPPPTTPPTIEEGLGKRLFLKCVTTL